MNVMFEVDVVLSEAAHIVKRVYDCVRSNSEAGIPTTHKELVEKVTGDLYRDYQRWPVAWSYEAKVLAAFSCALLIQRWDFSQEKPI